MLFNGKPLDSITEDDLQALIDLKVSENKIIEYKLELPKGNDSDTKEFLYDVSSFANASGGHLIYGIRAGTEEDKSLPVELCGLDGISDIDQLILGLNQKILAGIRPRIPGLNIQAVPLQNSRYTIVIEIPKSFSSPHMIIFKNDSKFYSRNSNGKYPLDVDELRLAFTLAQNIKERIIDFRRDRLSRVVSGETPVPLASGAKLVLHIIPISAFDSVFTIDVNNIVSLYSKKIEWFAPLEVNGSGWNQQYNFDGYLIYSRERQSHFSSSFLQIFRQGIIEATNIDFAGIFKQQNFIYPDYENMIINGLENYLRIQQNLGIEPPILIMLSLLGVKNHIMGVDHKFNRTYGNPITQNSLILPEVILEDYDSDLDEIMKPIFDIVWNAAGYPGSLNYT